jgi:hypothetical protein
MEDCFAVGNQSPDDFLNFVRAQDPFQAISFWIKVDHLSCKMHQNNIGIKIVPTRIHLFNETFSEHLEFKSFFNFRTEADACFNPNSIAADLFFSISS